METEKEVVIKIGFDKIQIALEKAADEMFKSTYSNPVSDLLKECIQDKKGEMKKIVDEIIINSIGNLEFKQKLGDVIIQKIVAGALKN